jgi:hypothetical protein
MTFAIPQLQYTCEGGAPTMTVEMLVEEPGSTVVRATPSSVSCSDGTLSDQLILSVPSTAAGTYEIGVELATILPSTIGISGFTPVVTNSKDQQIEASSSAATTRVAANVQGMTTFVNSPKLFKLATG